MPEVKYLLEVFLLPWSLIFALPSLYLVGKLLSNKELRNSFLNQVAAVIFLCTGTYFSYFSVQVQHGQISSNENDQPLLPSFVYFITHRNMPETQKFLTPSHNELYFVTSSWIKLIFVLPEGGPGGINWV